MALENWPENGSSVQMPRQSGPAKRLMIPNYGDSARKSFEQEQHFQCISEGQLRSQERTHSQLISDISVRGTGPYDWARKGLPS